MTLTAAPMIVPQTEKKKKTNRKQLAELVRKYKLGAEAIADTSNGCSDLFAKVRNAINSHATDGKGLFTIRWKPLALEKKHVMKQTLLQSSPWLGKFQNGWAAEALLKQFVDQRISDRQRRKKKEKRSTAAALGGSLYTVRGSTGTFAYAE